MRGGMATPPADGDVIICALCITVVMRMIMTIARSKITAQGQISVPAEVRKKLGLRPGSILEWHDEGDRVLVSRAGRYSFENIHRALFPKSPPKTRTIEEMKVGLRRYVKARRARR